MFSAFAGEKTVSSPDLLKNRRRYSDAIDRWHRRKVQQALWAEEEQSERTRAYAEKHDREVRNGTIPQRLPVCPASLPSEEDFAKLAKYST